MGLYFGTGAVGLNPPTVISNEMLSRHNVYGISFNGIGGKGKPLYNAIDQKWTAATPSDPGVDTWKDIAPFNVKKCITDYDADAKYGRKVLAYKGDENYESLKTAKTGDRMVEFPFGYYMRPDPWTFLVSPDPIEGFQPSPAHDLGGGVIVDVVRRSEFDCCNVDGIPKSIPGYAPWNYSNYNAFKNSFKAKGWNFYSLGMWSWINILRLIKQGDTNSQRVNGTGIVNQRIITMTEDNIQGLDGYVGLDQSDNIRTLGIQNFYGHTWNQIVNILVYHGTELWIKKNIVDIDQIPNYSNLSSYGYEKLDVPVPYVTYDVNKANFMTELALNKSNPALLYGSKAITFTGSNYQSNFPSSIYSDPICDGVWTYNFNTDELTIMRVGGGWDGALNGALACTFDSKFSDTPVWMAPVSMELG